MSKKYAMLIKVDGANNNNKFYEITWNDDDSVTARYGRCGNIGVTENKGYGEAAFDKVFKAKTNPSKGYKKVDVLTNESTGSPTNSSNKITSSLTEIAKRDIANNNPIMDDLLDRLAKVNQHQLLQATGDQIDIVNGVVQTVLGPITLNSVTNARTKLNNLKKLIQYGTLDDTYLDDLNQYLTYIPQVVPRNRGWANTFLTNYSSFDKQYELLDQIEQSIHLYEMTPKTVETNPKKEVSKIFGYSLEKMHDNKEISRIEKYYRSNINKSHACSHLKLKNVYKLSNDTATEIFVKKSQKLGNVKELWHGTRIWNILSILKSGLRVPTASQVMVGSMFSRGIYFSDQSSKAINYAWGYWDNKGRTNNCFAFIAGVTMGKEYIPSKPFNNGIPSGYDSCFAMAHRSGVQNNEMVVYDESQVNLKYLCEFDG